jgi:hypothetical protein
MKIINFNKIALIPYLLFAQLFFINQTSNIDELASKTEHRVQQNLKLRSYYGLKNKPENLGFVSWDCTAEKIDRLCRALSFGSYRNELATPKLIINDQ